MRKEIHVPYWLVWSMGILILLAGIVYSSYYFVSKDIIGYEEIKRISSPDNEVDAVWVQTNGGATTAYGYCLYIVPKGQQFNRALNPRFRANHMVLEDIKWIQPKILEIKYSKAHIFDFINFWSSRDVHDFDYIVEIQLVLTSKTALICGKRDGV
jgi:hypothetical protein